MSAILDILDRLSGVAILKERMGEVNKNLDRSLVWLLDHEKRLIRLEGPSQSSAPASSKATTRRLSRK